MKRVCKEKKCRACKEVFTPYSSLSVTCSIACAIAHTEMKAEKKLKRDIKLAKQVVRFDLKRRKDKLKSKSDWMREAQTACNAYIRARDGNKCISCGTEKPVQFCGGHFKSRGSSPEIRFHPFNINSQCNSYCNNHLSGNIENYRPALIDKIGLSNVEWLEGPHKPQKLSIDDIKEIKQYYKEQLKLIKS